MSEGGTIFDDPNREAVGLEPAWVEGTGGSGEAPKQPAEPADLDEMTKAELLEHAKSLGVSPANNDMTKEDLRTAIDEHEAGG